MTTCQKETGKHIGREGHIFAGTRLTALKTFRIGPQEERADIVEFHNQSYSLVIIISFEKVYISRIVLHFLPDIHLYCLLIIL